MAHQFSSDLHYLINPSALIIQILLATAALDRPVRLATTSINPLFLLTYPSLIMFISYSVHLYPLLLIWLILVLFLIFRCSQTAFRITWAIEHCSLPAFLFSFLSTGSVK